LAAAEPGLAEMALVSTARGTSLPPSASAAASGGSPSLSAAGAAAMGVLMSSAFSDITGAAAPAQSVKSREL